MSRSADLNSLVDRVYETALVPQLWPQVLESIADAMGAESAVLHSVDQSTCKGWAVLARVDPAAEPDFFGYYSTRNPIRARRNRLIRLFDDPQHWRNCIVSDEHALPKSELMRSEYYNDFLRHIGVHSIICVGLAFEETRFASINILRSPRKDAFDDCDFGLVGHLHPHMIRAFELGRRLTETRQLGDSFAQSLDRSPNGIFLVDGNARLRHANRAALAMIDGPCGLAVKDGILRGATPAATRALHSLIGTAGAEETEQRSGGATSLPRPGFPRPLSVIVAPLHSEHRSLFRQAPSVIVCATDPDSGALVPEDRLRALFGFTAAEAKIATELLAGCDSSAIAERKSLSVNTVRVHIARIMAKTETNRQAELVRLLERVSGLCVE